jgi:hypothetical protein
VVPALRQEREGRGTRCVADGSEIKSLGHPPAAVLVVPEPNNKRVGRPAAAVEQRPIRLPKTPTSRKNRETWGTQWYPWLVASYFFDFGFEEPLLDDGELDEEELEDDELGAGAAAATARWRTAFCSLRISQTTLHMSST